MKDLDLPVIKEYKFENPPLTQIEKDRFITLSYRNNLTESESKEYNYLKEKDLKNFCEIMSGMDEVNNQMAEDIDKALKKEQPICHFTKMDYEDGLWICKHCGHEIESEVYIPDYECY